MTLDQWRAMGERERDEAIAAIVEPKPTSRDDEYQYAKDYFVSRGGWWRHNGDGEWRPDRFPTRNRDDLAALEAKLGERGLGEVYALELTKLVFQPRFDGRERTVKDVVDMYAAFTLKTAPGPTCCEAAMLAVAGEGGGGGD